jgi:hypothetical protein
MENLFKKITVVISSCDSYSVLWDSFAKCFKKYWEIDCDIVFVSETKTHSSFKSVTPGNLPWGERNRIAIQNINTEYIFWILEDYFFSRSIRKDDLHRYLEDFQKFNMDRLQIGPRGSNNYINSYADNKLDHKPKFDYLKISSSEDYSICMQPSIWRKEFILKVLDKDYTPWDFEIIGSSKNTSNKVYIDNSIKYHLFFNAVRKKNVRNLSWFISKIDKLIENMFYGKLPFKYSKGLKSFLKHEKIN